MGEVIEHIRRKKGCIGVEPALIKKNKKKREKR